MLRPLRPVLLRLATNFPAEGWPIITEVQGRLVALRGAVISISAKPQLTAHRGKLLSGQPDRGTAVHAATFIRLRRIVLEKELLVSSDALRLILAHELFHFAWVRLGNPLRRSYGDLLEEERRAGARGELGESADVRKRLLPARWRDYVCESFCDTAAWFYFPETADSCRSLAARWRRRREQWCRTHFAGTISC